MRSQTPRTGLCRPVGPTGGRFTKLGDTGQSLPRSMLITSVVFIKVLQTKALRKHTNKDPRLTLADPLASAASQQPLPDSYLLLQRVAPLL